MLDEDNQKEEEIEEFDIGEKRKQLFELWSDIFTIARRLVDDIKSGEAKMNASMLSTVTTLLTKSSKILDDAEKAELKVKERANEDEIYDDDDGTEDLQQVCNLVEFAPEEYFEQYREYQMYPKTYSKARQVGIELTPAETAFADEWDSLSKGGQFSVLRKQGQTLHQWEYQMADAFEAGDPDPQDPRDTGMKSAIQGGDLHDGLNFKRD